jgi:mono/diheme cytochrome c family protein
MRVIRFIVVCCFILALAAGILVFAAWRAAIAPIVPPAADSFAPDLVRHGAELAAIGACDTCHTAPAGAAFAGSRAIPTPFGTIYSTNITPDAETGIGAWSEAAFVRALRRGVRRDGAYLYPAFPYDHFTLVSDDDDKALYAFLMTRRPVRAKAPKNDLPFPLDVRLVLYGWNFLFLRPGPYQADGAHNVTWNRGAYLAEGLGHCGACHTPRNAFGAEKSGEPFAGGAAEGWTAYALNAASPAPMPWTQEALAQYLHDGFSGAHGVALGPMANVLNDLRAVPEDETQAIASYMTAGSGDGGARDQKDALADTQKERGKAVANVSADSQADMLKIAAATTEGGMIYAGACAGCHQGPRGLPYGGIDLSLSSTIGGPSPDNLINVVLFGLPARGAAHVPIMPGFADSMDDGQIAALVRDLRARFSEKAPWSDIEKVVREARGNAAVARYAPASAPASPGTEQRSANEAQR